MRNEAYIRFIDAHTESRGGTDDFHTTSSPFDVNAFFFSLQATFVRMK